MSISKHSGVEESVPRQSHKLKHVGSTPTPARESGYPYKTIKFRDGTTGQIHRLIMENHVGRKLSYNECVHHKDGNPRNNEISNLEIVDRAEHIRHHLRNGDIPKMVHTEVSKQKLRNHFSSISEVDARAIKYGNERAKDICKRLGVSKWVVSRIRRNESWCNV